MSLWSFEVTGTDISPYSKPTQPV
ncbi:hypothetical protein PITCH_A1640039 [uncultured Desulfobacterium sp.]|uniref:Uncharacterized protein n=1 Tax=uncultured Desulfobacterium sp. TaxID=201089 RepID=A0A445MUF1_9BACT|nr:hypothetical protein PITCH_A1640039 [uncultured Desulfobacterium sp.]